VHFIAGAEFSATHENPWDSRRLGATDVVVEIIVDQDRAFLR